MLFFVDPESAAGPCLESTFDPELSVGTTLRRRYRLYVEFVLVSVFITRLRQTEMFPLRHARVMVMF